MESISFEFHRGLLLLHGVFLLGITRVNLLNFRLQDAHLGRRHIRLEGQRRDHDLDDQREQKNNQTVRTDEAAHPVEERDDHIAGDRADHLAAQRDDILELLAVALQRIEVVRPELEMHGDAVICAAGIHIQGHVGA